MSHIVVMTTCHSEEEARQIGEALVGRKLAACVQSSVISTIYRWNGAVEHARELRLMIKTTLANYAAVEACIKSLHSYETPQILALPIVAGSAEYLRWLDTETNPGFA